MSASTRIPGFRYVGTTFHPAFVTQDGRVWIGRVNHRKWVMQTGGVGGFEVLGREAAIREAKRVSAELDEGDARVLRRGKELLSREPSIKAFKKSHAQIKREVDAVLAMKPAALFPREAKDEMSWKSSDPLFRNWRVETRATADPAVSGSRWEAVSGTPNSHAVTKAEALDLYSRLVNRGYRHVRIVQRHPRDAFLERVVSSTENEVLSGYGP